jgi:hypothetical protein
MIQVSGTSNFILNTLLKNSRDPIVVFVWFQETARLLQQQIQSASVLDEGREGNSLVCKTLTGELLIQQVRVCIYVCMYSYLFENLFLTYFFN